MANEMEFPRGIIINSETPTPSSEYLMIDPTGLVTRTGYNLEKVVIQDGPPSANQLAFFNGTNTIIGSEGLTWDGSILNVSGSVNFGNPGSGSESSLGEGASYSEGMLVFTQNSTGGITDITSTAKDTTGTFSFDGNAVNSAIYISSDIVANGDYLRPPGFDYRTTAALVHSGTSEILLEYWNGSSWVSFHFMVNDFSEPHLAEAENLFNDIGHHHVRFNWQIRSTWVKTTIGTGEGSEPPRFWFRVRIDTAPVTTLPTFLNFKLLTNAIQINPNGYIEYFGSARPIANVPFDASFFLGTSTDNPGNQDIWASQPLGTGRINNSFAGNSGTDRSGLIFYLPYDLDTSCPLQLVISWFGNGNASNNGQTVKWFVYWGKTSDGDTIHTAYNSASTTIASQNVTSQTRQILAGEHGTQLQTVFNLDVSQFIARTSGDIVSDTMWLSIERNANDPEDTYSSSAVIIQVTPLYTRWNNGSYRII